MAIDLIDVESRIQRLGNLEIRHAHMLAARDLVGSRGWREYVDRLNSMRSGYLELLAKEQDVGKMRFLQWACHLLADIGINGPTPSGQDIDRVEREIEGLRHEVQRMHNAGLIEPKRHT